MKKVVLAMVYFGWVPFLAAASLGAQQPKGGPADSAFLLETNDPGRSPSPFIGNGRLGVVVPSLGLGASPSFKAGLYEHGPGDVPRIVAIPAGNALGVHDGKDWLDSGRSSDPRIHEYRQVLDMRTGTVRTGYAWMNGGRRIAVKAETFVSRADPHLMVTRLDLTPQQEGRIRVRSVLAGWPPPKRLPLARLERADRAWRPADIWYPGHMLVRSREAVRDSRGARLSLTAVPVGRTATLAEAATLNWPGDLRNPAAHTTAAGDTAIVEVAFDASAGRTYTFFQTTSIVSSDEVARPLEQASRQVETARSRGFDRLAADNARAWASRWQTDIEISGNPELQRVVRSMLFYLLCSADSGTQLGVPPMGLSSAGYYGHIFWDSDTWMFPSLLLTHPDIAHSLVAFRGRTLPAAKDNARLNGFRGAMYPWEADERGVETTPHFAVQNARSEIHVNGDVALAQWQYYQATGDSSWLAREGFPVMKETADFWVSRSVCGTSDERCHIENVVSVAEGLIGVTDDAYTNAVARKNLEIAAAASKKLNRRADPRWSLLASKLHLPYDSVSGFFRTYEGAPDSTLGWVTPLLAYPLAVPMSPRAKRAQLEQAFAQLLKEGPGAMMGSTILAVGAAELNDRPMVDSLLPFSYRTHMKGPFLMLSETPTNNAVNFVTGAGGFLQQVIFGWTGLRLGDNGLEPAYPALLPSSVERLVLRHISIRGKRYDVTVDRSGRRMTPSQPEPSR
jgi:trehalose/maltose hydrolase-like predicted phosphorylase